MRSIIAVIGVLSLALLWPTGIVLAGERDGFRAELERDMARDTYQSILAGEEKEAEYQMAKTVTDVHGNRVRMEGYVLKPSPEQYKLLALNTRDGRIDYGYHLFTFNKPVSSLDVLNEASWGMWEEQPNYWIKGVETKLSNTIDNVTTKEEMSDPREIDLSLFSGRQPVTEEAEAIIVTCDGEMPVEEQVEQVELVEEPATEEAEDIIIICDGEVPVEEPGMEVELELTDPENIPERIYLQTDYHYTCSVNGKVKEEESCSFSPETGIVRYEAWYPTSASKGELVLGDKYEYDIFNDHVSTMISDSRVVPDYEYSADEHQSHWKNRTNYKDGTFLSEETFIIDDEGNIEQWDIPEILPDEITESNGEVLEVLVTEDGMKALNEYGRVPNIEMIITATEFEGRTIDLVYPMAVPEIGFDYYSLSRW